MAVTSCPNLYAGSAHAAISIPNGGEATITYGEMATPIRSVRISGSWLRMTPSRSFDHDYDPIRPIWNIRVCTGSVTGTVTLVAPYRAHMTAPTDKCEITLVSRAPSYADYEKDVPRVKAAVKAIAPQINLGDNQVAYFLKRAIPKPSCVKGATVPTPTADQVWPLDTAVTVWFNGTPQGQPAGGPGVQKVRVDLGSVNWGAVEDSEAWTAIETNIDTIEIP